MFGEAVKRLIWKITAVFVLAATIGCSAPSSFAHMDTVQAAEKAVYQIVARNGYKCWMQAIGAKGKVKWSSSNQDVAKILSKNNTECEVMPLKDGRATITARADNITIKYKVAVETGKKFLDAWCRQWVKDNITQDMDVKEKLILASAYVVSNNNRYGSTSEPEDVITTGTGTCVSGGKLVAALCEAMGYDAKVRFAAKDDMSRYPPGVIFMEQHYNVEVKAGGKKYYIDGTPGGLVVYLCTKKKTLYYGYSVKDQIYPPDALMDIPVEELLG